MTNEIDEEMNFTFEFTSPTSVDVEESAIGVALIKGTLLAEGMSRNGNLYTLDQMEKIARTAEGAPIFYGTMEKIDPNTGVNTKNMHANIEPMKVGKILQTFLDPIARKIKFIAQIVASEMFPHLIEEVKHGWGISIGGSGKACFVFDKTFKRILTKVMDLTVNHVQLLPPSLPRGQDAAQVEGDPEPRDFQESMVFYELPPEPKVNITEIHLGAGTKIEFPKED